MFIIQHLFRIVKVSRKNIQCAGVAFRGYGRFLKKAPQKLYTAAAGLWGGYGFVEKGFQGDCALTFSSSQSTKYSNPDYEK